METTRDPRADFPATLRLAALTAQIERLTLRIARLHSRGGSGDGFEAHGLQPMLDALTSKRDAMRLVMAVES